MRRFVAVALGALILGAVGHSQVDYLKERSEGFLALFNGINLDGWSTNEEGWDVEDSTIIGDAATRLIATSRGVFSDYVLRFEWKISGQGRAAVLLRGSGSTRAAITLQDRPEGSGGMEALNLRPSKRMDHPAGEWNRMEIQMRAGVVEVKLNDQPVLSRATVPELPERGPIAFQNLGATLSVRAVRLKPLGLDLAFFVSKVQPTFKLQCVGCHTGESAAAQKMQLQVPDLGNYTDAQIMSDYLEAAERVKQNRPDESLLLLKGSGKVKHGGGRQFAVDGPEYRNFAAWIKGETLRK